MKDKTGGRQLGFDFSSQSAKQGISVLRLVHRANGESVLVGNKNNMDMRVRVLENLLKTRITKS